MKIGQIVGFGKISVGEKWYVGDALYKTNRIYTVHSGYAGCYDKNGKTVISEGRIYFVPETVYFAPAVIGDTEFLHSYADFSLISPAKCDRIISMEPDGTEAMKLALDTFTLACRRRSAGVESDAADESDFFDMFRSSISYLVTRIADANGVDFISDSAVTQAISLMNRRMHEKLTVSDMAAYVYMCEDGFIRRFSRVMGLTPYAYLKRLRLTTAEGLINDGVSVADAACRVGYSDASALLHAFTKEKLKIIY